MTGESQQACKQDAGMGQRGQMEWQMKEGFLLAYQGLPEMQLCTLVRASERRRGG